MEGIKQAHVAERDFLSYRSERKCEEAVGHG